MFSYDEEEVLCREAAMSCDALAVGITSLRKSNMTEKGRLYSALHMITIGLERMLKIACILSSAVGDGIRLEQKEMKVLGHDLGKLLNSIKNLNRSLNLDVDETGINDDLVSSIIALLTDFAKYLRYHNLDSILKNNATANSPLIQWEKIRNDICKRHFKFNKRFKEGMHLASMAESEGGIVVSHNSYINNGIDNLVLMELEYHLNECGVKFGVYYVVKIIEFASLVIEELERKRSGRKDLSEFFRTFLVHRGKLSLKKRRWDAWEV